MIDEYLWQVSSVRHSPPFNSSWLLFQNIQPSTRSWWYGFLRSTPATGPSISLTLLLAFLTVSQVSSARCAPSSWCLTTSSVTWWCAWLSPASVTTVSLGITLIPLDLVRRSPAIFLVNNYGHSQNLILVHQAELASPFSQPNFTFH